MYLKLILFLIFTSYIMKLFFELCNGHNISGTFYVTASFLVCVCVCVGVHVQMLLCVVEFMCVCVYAGAFCVSVCAGVCVCK